MGDPQPHHAFSLTEEQRTKVADWVMAAINNTNLTRPQLTRKLGIGTSGLSTWSRGIRTPSQHMMEWISKVTGYPLPEDVKELGAPSGRVSKRLGKRMAALEQRGLTASAALYLPDDADEPKPVRPALQTKPPKPNDVPVTDRMRMAETIMDMVFNLIDPLSFTEVQAWLHANAERLTEEERLALMRELMR